MQVFQYMVVLNEKRDKDNEVVEDAEIVVPITETLARDESQAQMLAARAIPNEMVENGKLDRLMVVVRPFLRGVVEEAEDEFAEDSGMDEVFGHGGLVRNTRKTLAGIGHIGEHAGIPGYIEGPSPGTWQTGTVMPGVVVTNNTSQATYASASALLGNATGG